MYIIIMHSYVSTSKWSQNRLNVIVVTQAKMHCLHMHMIPEASVYISGNARVCYT